MESPESNPQPLDREPQGSPTFSFLCTLSPIKPLKSAHLAQTFADIGFSTASTNFVKVRRGDSRPLKRENYKVEVQDVQVSEGDAQKPIALVGGIENYESLANNNGIRKNPLECLEKTTEESSQRNISNIGSESCAEKKACTHNRFSKSVHIAEVPAPSIDPKDDGCDRPTMTTVENSHCNNNHTLKGLDKSVESEGVLADMVDIPKRGGSGDKSLQNTALQGHCEANSNIECEGIKKLLDFDQDISELEFMMLVEGDKPYQPTHMNEGETHASSNLQGPSIEEVEGYIASLKDVVNEKQQVLETVSSAGLLKHDESDQVEKSDAEELLKHQGLKNNECDSICRENGLSQRGVRRRCLNFNMLDCSPIKTEASERTVSMPSGIGLHLNTLTRTLTFPRTRKSSGCEGSRSTMIRSTSYMETILMPKSPEPNTFPKEMPRLLKDDLEVDIAEKTKIDASDAEPLCSDSVADSSKTATGIMQLEDVSILTRRPCPLGRKRVSLPSFPDPEDSTSSPLKKKRKTSTAQNLGDGCKRCNCKKSKCLKLYCECFAAGVYCVGSCSCQGCLNKPESEKIVLETRQQIESRNPLAFAPKIIHTEASPTNSKDVGGEIPRSGRHKRGCNCKRSHCLKKYCECYQAGVGCSDGCRCDNCKNTYGRKSGDDRDRMKTQSDDLHKNVNASDFCDQDSEISRQQVASPMTPSFDISMQSRTGVYSSSSKRFLATPEELQTPDFSLTSRSPSRLLRSCTKGTQRGSTDIANSRTMCSGASPLSTPRILRIGSHWDGLTDVTPVSKVTCKPSFSESSMSGRFQHLSDCRTQTIPTTPVFSSPASHCFKESGIPDNQRLDSAEDDDDSCTPQFLRDPMVEEAGSLPVCLLNSSSPKHKRVSPPHFHGSRGQVRQTNSCIRNGRKFILQSVPSLPATPCNLDGTQVSAGCENRTGT